MEEGKENSTPVKVTKRFVEPPPIVGPSLYYSVEQRRYLLKVSLVFNFVALFFLTGGFFLRHPGQGEEISFRATLFRLTVYSIGNFFLYRYLLKADYSGTKKSTVHLITAVQMGIIIASLFHCVSLLTASMTVADLGPGNSREITYFFTGLVGVGEYAVYYFIVWLFSEKSNVLNERNPNSRL
ncbi:MAG: hypothetical protein J0L72_08925 [Armatimonadetes bacterium]|nr:hypothetical protein [Armatimonadota bacterium]